MRLLPPPQRGFPAGKSPVFVIHHRESMYGVHLRRAADANLTQTHIMAFQEQRAAELFSHSLALHHLLYGEWPPDNLLGFHGSRLTFKQITHSSEWVSNPLAVVPLPQMELFNRCARNGLWVLLAEKRMPGSQAVLECQQIAIDCGMQKTCSALEDCYRIET